MNNQAKSPEGVAQQWRQSTLHDMLKDRFGDAAPAMLEAIQAHAQWEELLAGETLFQQGESSDRMFIVISGRLRISALNHEGDENTVVEVTAGETLGEFSLLTDEARSATATAVRESHLACLSSADFHHLLQTYPLFGRTVMKIIIERQQRILSTKQSHKHSALCLAIVPTSPTLSIDAFMEQLVSAWPQDGEILVLNSKRFDELYGQPDVAYATNSDAVHPSVTAWMGRQEGQYRYLIYVTDAVWNEWTKRCLNHVDQVLIVVDSTADSQQSEVEVAIQKQTPHLYRMLALWHPHDTQRPTGTAAWLEKRTVKTHYHVRDQDQDHMQRLARHLSGNAIGLVFSGGGVKGAAHAGVYRAIVELGIPIDCVGGTSAGSMAAGLIACGDSYDLIVEKMGKRVNAASMVDYTLPITSLMRSKKLTQTCQNFFRDTQMEDLWLPCFCVSTNLTRSEQRIHRRGPLWRAVRASAALPGVYAPVIEEGEMLVDGGVLNNLPIDVMAEEIGSPYIIAVNLNPKRTKERKYDFDVSLSGWQVLISRFNPFQRRIASPAIFSTIIRTTMVASDKLARESETLAQLVLYPHIRGVGMLDFSKYRPVVDAGYEAALEPLTQWRRQYMEGLPERSMAEVEGSD
ncbi:MAG: patatin-like phospholipase family protein [Chloroflexota bacterium]